MRATGSARVHPTARRHPVGQRRTRGEAKALAGLKGYIANLAACPDGTPEFVIGAYHQLFQIEKSFRMAKSDLQAQLSRTFAFFRWLSSPFSRATGICVTIGRPDAEEDVILGVGVLGAGGRMGSLVCRAITDAEDMRVAAAIGKGVARAPLEAADVVIDFTHPDAVMDNLHWCISHFVDIIVGTSGFDEGRLARVRSWLSAAPSVRVLIVPNFSVGAVLMMRFAAEAARFFESSEIVELHHAGKTDAPSGTASRIASIVSESRQSAGLGPMPDVTATAVEGSRGALLGTVRVHSIRLTGLLGVHEVLFGGLGEMLTIRHDSLDRASFVPGVLLAIRQLGSLPAGLTIGLDPLLGLG